VWTRILAQLMPQTAISDCQKNLEINRRYE
jgi:hypothetical protein